MKIKQLTLAIAGSALLAGAAGADVKVGALMAFTGPIESLTVGINRGAEVAAKEINDAGGVVGGNKIELVSADTTCVDASAASAAADRLVNAEKVAAIVGALCSGATIAAANSAAIQSGVVMVSPASTSPAVTSLDDNDLVFRTAPSDARQGQVLSDVLLGEGIKSVAVTYINNDYGKGFNDAFTAAYTAAGGTVTGSQAHEDGKADYRAEISALAAGGADVLVVLAYLDGSGQTIIRQAIEEGDFSRFAGGDGMVGQSLVDAIGDKLDGMIATQPGGDNEGTDTFKAIAEANGWTVDGPYQAEAYDAVALIALAMQSKGNTDREGMAKAIRAVAGAPGEEIKAGELARGLKILADGGEVNYQGATSVEFDDAGDPPGSYLVMKVTGGKFEQQAVVK
ncbi:MAG: branched-chain amino acid ABC transporter substrate-binding protein [marine bacterium B5-7]|nr:MAG: branched-chain amino acid ABC transporter substrate-binding protein [marine bacterium B5-7]